MQKTEIMKKFFGLRETRLADCAMDIYWADYWSGSLGTHPGSGTGSQTLEGFHSFWQSLLSKRTRQSPCKCTPDDARALSRTTGAATCLETSSQARHSGQSRQRQPS